MVSKMPKILHPIMGKPMIHYVATASRRVEADRIVTVIGHGREMVERYLQDQGTIIAMQHEQKGTAHALLTAEPFLNDGDILVLYGDVPLIKAETLEGFKDFFFKSEGITFMTTEVDRPDGYGRVIVEGDQIHDIVEDSDAKGAVRDIRIINTGICMIARECLDLVKAIPANNAKGEYYLTDVCKIAKDRGIKVKAYHHPHPGEVLGINTRKDLLEANLLMKTSILDRHMENGVTIVDRSTYIESDVVIARDTVILPYCCLRGRTEIAEDVTIGPHVTIRDCMIGKGATVDGFSSLTGVVVEEGVTIGPFAHKTGDMHQEKSEVAG
jgi:bifunctional UDP-N-acetylglucosamine pyrophosphorylase/glucosamine-1-phosphate N-acetyltransferase